MRWADSKAGCALAPNTYVPAIGAAQRFPNTQRRSNCSSASLFSLSAIASWIMLDLVRPGLRLVVCGAVAGRASAARSGNRLWHVLHEVGLTSSVLQPGDYTLLLENGVGLTALAEDSADMDDALHSNTLFAARLRDVVEAIKPRALAFNGKKTASMFYHAAPHRLSYGVA